MEKHVEKRLGHSNLTVITNKYDSKCKNSQYELKKNFKKQLNRKFLREDLAVKIIMDCRTSESCEFKKSWDLNCMM